MKNRYGRRFNPKIIALIIVIALLLILSIVVLILNNNNISLPVIPLLLVYALLIIALVLVLSLIRYDRLREIRSDGQFKSSNLPLYTDKTTLLCHDIKDEAEDYRNKKE